MNPQDRCPKCKRPSTDTWQNDYKAGFIGRVWGGTCPNPLHGRWAESTPCIPVRR